MWQVIPQPGRLLAAHRDIETVQAGQGEAQKIRTQQSGRVRKSYYQTDGVGEVKTGYFDKHEKEITVGDTVKFSSSVRTGTRRDRKGNSFSINEIVEIVGIVKFGSFNYYLDTMKTFYVETQQTTTYPSYFYSRKRSDPPKQTKENLSRVLTEGLSKNCEII